MKADDELISGAELAGLGKLEDNFATKQAQKSPYSAVTIGALEYGGERVFLTSGRSFPLMSRNTPIKLAFTVFQTTTLSMLSCTIASAHIKTRD